MKNNEIIFYDDTDNCSKFDEAKEFLFETQGEDQGWLCIEEVPDKFVWDEIYHENETDFHFFSEDMKRYMKDGHFLVTGICGRWDGDYAGGDFISGFDELIRNLDHLDYIKFYEVNGHFYIEGIHHDGRDRYEMKELTRKGLEYAQNNYFAHDKTLHNKIMKCNLYSRLPHIAKTIYGAV